MDDGNWMSFPDFLTIIQFSEMNNDGEIGIDTMIMIVGYTPMDNDTVDGRNPAPAPPWTVETLSIKGYCKPSINWCGISSFRIMDTSRIGINANLPLFTLRPILRGGLWESMANLSLLQRDETSDPLSGTF